MRGVVAARLEDPICTYVAKDPTVKLNELSSADFRSLPEYQKANGKRLNDLFAAGLAAREPYLEANLICPLVLAIGNGRAKFVSILLDAGADPNVLIGGKSRPLHAAATKGNPEIVRLLIAKGADVTALSADGYSPLSLAIGFQHGDVADLLRAAGAEKSNAR